MFDLWKFRLIVKVSELLIAFLSKLKRRKENLACINKKIRLQSF